MTEADFGDYLPWLRKVGGNLIGFGSPDLPDLVQEGYIEMWRASRTHDPGKGPLDYWLKFKASNRMKTVAIRDRHRLVPVEDNAIELLSRPDLLGEVELAYHSGEIAEAIDRLTPKQRQYVYARFWLGMRQNELTGQFGYDPSSLWNSKRNGARWKLQSSLGHLASSVTGGEIP